MDKKNCKQKSRHNIQVEKTLSTKGVESGQKIESGPQMEIKLLTIKKSGLDVYMWKTHKFV